MRLRKDGKCNHTIVVEPDLKERITILKKAGFNIQGDLRQCIEVAVNHYEQFLKEKLNGHKK